MERKCTDCGEAIRPGSPKCPNCGAMADAASQASPFGFAAPDPSAPDEPPQPAPQPDEPHAETSTACARCGEKVEEGVRRCPRCGHEFSSYPESGHRASTAEQIVVGLVFVFIGIPAGLFGACSGLVGISGGPGMASILPISLVCLAAFAVLAWLWFKTMRS